MTMRGIMPRPDDDDGVSDVQFTLLRMIFTFLPGGGLFNEVISLAQSRAFAGRLSAWQTRLEERFEEAFNEFPMSAAERLAADETFLTTLLNATLIAHRTSPQQEEKLQALCDATLNSALPNPPDEDLQLMFLNFVADFTKWHLRLLRFFDEVREWQITLNTTSDSLLGYARSIQPTSLVLATFPELAVQQAFCEQCIADLESRNLITLDANRLRYSPEPEQPLPPSFQKIASLASSHAPLTTEFGVEFLRFITAHGRDV